MSTSGRYRRDQKRQTKTGSPVSEIGRGNIGWTVNIFYNLYLCSKLNCKPVSRCLFNTSKTCSGCIPRRSIIPGDVGDESKSEDDGGLLEAGMGVDEY